MITPLNEASFIPLIQLANQVHGDNYLDLTALQQMYRQGLKHGINASFVAFEQQHLIGYRLSFAAGQWQPDQWCSKTLWPVSLQHLAYFKSVAIAPAWRGRGVASQLLAASMQALQQQGATAGLAHIWRESPDGAAETYFRRAGGLQIAVHQDRWRHLSQAGYLCPRCGNDCRCSAAEMLLYLPNGSDCP